MKCSLEKFVLFCTYATRFAVVIHSTSYICTPSIQKSSYESNLLCLG